MIKQTACDEIVEEETNAVITNFNEKKCNLLNKFYFLLAFLFFMLITILCHK